MVEVRSCHNCQFNELCFIRVSAERLIRSGLGILTDKGKLKGEPQTPGDTEGIYRAIAGACSKFGAVERD
jgi:hypothetical protein